MALFLLLILEGVESNPGPGGRGRTSRSNAGNRGHGRGTVQSTSVTENIVQMRGALRSHSQSQSEQPSLNAWISSGSISTEPRPEQTSLNSSRAQSSSNVESLFGTDSSNVADETSIVSMSEQIKKRCCPIHPVNRLI